MAERSAFLNDFDTIDYKRPIDKGIDYRTSTYRGHQYLSDASLQNRLPAKFKPTKEYSQDYKLEKNRLSDYKANFLWPPLETSGLTNPKLGFKQKFIKPYEERKLKFLKRPMRPATSSAHEDYQWRPDPIEFKPPLPIKLPSEIKTEKVNINRCQPGYAKYLDPTATTSRLAYCAMSPEEIGRSIARHDNITYWNWHKYHQPDLKVFRASDGRLCDDTTAKMCPKRHCEFQCQVKRVPNTGMTTEVRDNYLAPPSRPQEKIYDTTHIRNILVNAKQDPSPMNTEYRLLCSGERSQKFV